jgi:quercetin dioxygenase-like cupin family protein
LLVAITLCTRKDDPSSIADMLGWEPAEVRRKQMQRSAFETELREQGYAEIVERRMEANALKPEHAHEFDARVLILEGAMTITAEETERTYRAGDTFAISAGCHHSERSGSEGARYLAGRRFPAAR